MTHAVRIVAVVAVLTALAATACAPQESVSESATDDATTPEFDALRARAEAGNAVAQYTLALRYDFGFSQGVLQDDAEALRWFRLAAEQGHAAAQYNLGFMYRTGRGVPENPGEAIRWWRLAAEQGNAGALDRLRLIDRARDYIRSLLNRFGFWPYY